MKVYGDIGIYGLSEKRGASPAENVSIENIPNGKSVYLEPFLKELLPASAEGFDWKYDNDPLTEKAFETQYMSSADLKGSLVSDNDMMILRCKTLEMGSSDSLSLTIAYDGGERSFAGRHIGSGYNPVPSFPWMTYGGNGDGATNAPLGGKGFSGGAYLANGNQSKYTHGGGFIMVIADSIHGGSINASGGTHSNIYGTVHGGGGIVLIFTKEWKGTTSINVGSGSSNEGTDGSYAIIKIEDDESLTLMVHSKNGQSATLNGQTAVHDTDASIVW